MKQGAIRNFPFKINAVISTYIIYTAIVMGGGCTTITSFHCYATGDSILIKVGATRHLFFAVRHLRYQLQNFFFKC